MEETGEIKTLIQRKRMELAAGTKISRAVRRWMRWKELSPGRLVSERSGSTRENETIVRREEESADSLRRTEAETETSGLKKNY